MRRNSKSIILFLMSTFFWENAELYKEIHSEDRFKPMILKLLNQLPRVPNNAGTVSSGQTSTSVSCRGMEVDLTGDGN